MPINQFAGRDWAMRSAKEVEYFPYRSKLMCYIEIFSDGTVKKIPHVNKSDRKYVQQAYERVLAGKSALYVVWPGQWTSDLFVIDDLPAFAKAFELE